MRKRYLLPLLGLLLAGLCYASHPLLLPWAMRWLDVGQPPRPTDSIFVLLGGEDVRPFVAAALYKAGYGQEVVFANFGDPAAASDAWPAYHDIFRTVLLRRGVPEDRIRVIGDGVENTMQEISELAQYLRRRPELSVTVVTTHFHSRRTRWTLKRQLGEDFTRVRLYTSPRDDFDFQNWWMTEYGMVYVMTEYIKLLGYWVVYGDAVWWSVGVGLAVLAAWGAWRWRSSRLMVGDGIEGTQRREACQEERE